jgi:hypothetical protein
MFALNETPLKIRILKFIFAKLSKTLLKDDGTEKNYNQKPKSIHSSFNLTI